MRKNNTQTLAAAPREASRAAGRARSSPRRPSASAHWNLRLYVAGQTPRSLSAFSNLKRLCETHLRGRYRIEVVDLLRSPHLAEGDQIVALPTLVRHLPPPMRRIIGDLSDADRVLVGMEMIPETERRRPEQP